MTSGSSMLAITPSFPPQRAQSSISMPNTRFSRRTQLIAPCRGVGGLATSAAGSYCGAAIPRCDGVTAPRSRLCGAEGGDDLESEDGYRAG